MRQLSDRNSANEPADVLLQQNQWVVLRVKMAQRSSGLGGTTSMSDARGGIGHSSGA